MGYSFEKEEAKKSPVDLQTAIAKAKAYCTHRERSQQELRDKLYHLGVWKAEVEQTITEMIIQGFLSEERFAQAYAADRFRLNRWGKFKIRQGLKENRVPDNMIGKALAVIDPDEYEKAVVYHAEKFLSHLKENIAWRRKVKVTDFLRRQGFEYDVIRDVLKEHEELK